MEQAKAKIRVRKARCRACQNKFEYPDRGRRRHVCDACQTAVRVQSNQRQKQRRAVLLKRRPQDAQARHKHGLPWFTQDQIAYALGITAEMVYEAERRALAKLRQHPELLELLARVREEGIPLQEDLGARVLEYQLALNEWWRLHDELLTRKLTDEAVECLAEIKKFQQELKQFLKR